MRTEHTTLVAQLIFIKSEKRDSATRTTRSGHGPKVAQRLTLIDMLIANRCDCDCDCDDDCNDDDSDDDCSRDCNSHLGTRSRADGTVQSTFNLTGPTDRWQPITQHMSVHVQVSILGMSASHSHSLLFFMLYARHDSSWFLAFLQCSGISEIAYAKESSSLPHPRSHSLSR